jgi:hypothetical protein
MIAKKIGRYELGTELGQGPLGSLFRVRADGDEAVCRVVRARAPVTRADVERFAQNARLAMGLEHPSLAAVTDVVLDGDRLAVVFAAKGGELLAHAQKQMFTWRRTMPVPIALRIALDLCAAHGFAHGEAADLPVSAAFGGVSPDSVLVGPDGVTLVLDLFLAPAAAGTGLTTSARRAAYQAPEHFQDRPLQPASDVFALGAMLWELLLNRPLFGATTLSEVKRRVLAPVKRVDAVHSPGGPIPKALADVVARALHESPGERPASMAELAKELEAVGGAPATAQEVAAFIGVLVLGGTDKVVPSSAPKAAPSSPGAPGGGVAGAAKPAPLGGEKPAAAPRAIAPKPPLPARVGAVPAGAGAPRPVAPGAPLKAPAAPHVAAALLSDAPVSLDPVSIEALSLDSDDAGWDAAPSVEVAGPDTISAHPAPPSEPTDAGAAEPAPPREPAAQKTPTPAPAVAAEKTPEPAPLAALDAAQEPPENTEAAPPATGDDAPAGVPDSQRTTVPAQTLAAQVARSEAEAEAGPAAGGADLAVEGEADKKEGEEGAAAPDDAPAATVPARTEASVAPEGAATGDREASESGEIQVALDDGPEAEAAPAPQGEPEREVAPQPAPLKRPARVHEPRVQVQGAVATPEPVPAAEPAVATEERRAATTRLQRVADEPEPKAAGGSRVLVVGGVAIAAAIGLFLVLRGGGAPEEPKAPARTAAAPPKVEAPAPPPVATPAPTPTEGPAPVASASASSVPAAPSASAPVAGPATPAGTVPAAATPAPVATARPPAGGGAAPGSGAGTGAKKPASAPPKPAEKKFIPQGI